MIDPSSIASGLERASDGIWYAQGETTLSYPEDGNRVCLDLEPDSFWFHHRSQVLLAVLRRFPPGGTIFDIGGGNGFVATTLIRGGYDVVLVEPGEAGARNARRRGVDTVICATLETAGFQPHSLPAAGLFDVLEHIEDDVAFLESFRRHLDPAGHIYLTVPAHSALWSGADVYAGHYRRYTLSSLRASLAQGGFEILFDTYFFRVLQLPILLLRALPFRLGLIKENDVRRNRKEHSPTSAAVRKLLHAVLKTELGKIERGERMRFGSSCLAVARPRP